jgi:amidophosphoribosyltransferase
MKKLKKKFKIYDPKLKEECAVFGISNNEDAATLTALGLHALQHRGQEGCGIVSFDGFKYHSEKRFGLVGDNFNDEKVLKNLPGKFAIGHNRYSTTGGTALRNVQPFFADTNSGGIGVAHNGNLTNAITLRNKMVQEGSIFYTTSDTETIVKLIAKSKRVKTIDKIIDAIFQIQGGYALVMMTQNTLIGVRDPYGIRPLVIGKLKNSSVFASETCAFDIIGAKFVREVENGEIVYIENDELKSIKPFPPKKVRPCVFEYIYFSRPDSILNGKTAYEYRKNFGAQLANEDNINVDLVVPVPDSGNAAAIGYSQQKKIDFDLGLIRNHYVGRTFIEPGQQIRSLGVKLKLNANKSSIENKKIILVDDSLVRGTTSHKIVKMLYDAGAKEVHLRIACPEIKFPDFYGVDMPTKKELLAANKSVEEICDYVKAKSLKFLSLEGLYIALGYLKRDSNKPQLTDHYFTGDYPIKLIDQLGDNKITQLSLLSAGSNI